MRQRISNYNIKSSKANIVQFGSLFFSYLNLIFASLYSCSMTPVMSSGTPNCLRSFKSSWWLAVLKALTRSTYSVHIGVGYGSGGVVILTWWWWRWHHHGSLRLYATQIMLGRRTVPLGHWAIGAASWDLGGVRPPSCSICCYCCGCPSFCT